MDIDTRAHEFIRANMQLNSIGERTTAFYSFREIFMRHVAHSYCIRNYTGDGIFKVDRDTQNNELLLSLLLAILFTPQIIIIFQLRYRILVWPLNTLMSCTDIN